MPPEGDALKKSMDGGPLAWRPGRIRSCDTRFKEFYRGVISACGERPRAWQVIGSRYVRFHRCPPSLMSAADVSPTPELPSTRGIRIPLELPPPPGLAMFQEPLDPREVDLRRYIQSDHVELAHEAAWSQADERRRPGGSDAVITPAATRSSRLYLQVTAAVIAVRTT